MMAQLEVPMLESNQQAKQLLSETAPKADLRLGDCVEIMKGIPSESIDVVLTDPPYQYLNHKLDRPFDEMGYFDEVARIVKPTGFHVTFGRGTSFYGWNIQLALRGFKFKEEIVWDKRLPSSPVLPILRFHETVSIYAKETGKIRESYIPYVEMREGDLGKIQEDLDRISSALKSEKTFEALKHFIQEYEASGKRPAPEFTGKQTIKHGVTINDHFKSVDRQLRILNPIALGMKERSIMQVTGERYTAEHPTQKPVRLMERLLALVSDVGQAVLDPFMGSGSTGVACLKQGRGFTGCEILPEYYEIAVRRIGTSSQFSHGMVG